MDRPRTSGSPSTVKPFRILVADLPTILREIVTRIAALRHIQVSSVHPRRSRLRRQLRREPADVVVLGLAETEVPEVCSQILDEFPGTTVVGLVADGRWTSFYVDDLGPDELLDTAHGVSRASHGGRRHPPTAREGER